MAAAKTVMMLVIDQDDEHFYVIPEAPANIRGLLREWHKLTKAFVKERQKVPHWQPLAEWLKARGIRVWSPKVVILD